MALVLAHTVHHIVADNLLNHDPDLVTVHTLRSHPTVPTTAPHDRRGKRAKKQAVGTLHVLHRWQNNDYQYGRACCVAPVLTGHCV